MPWPTQGVSTTTSVARLSPQTILDTYNLVNNTVKNSSVTDCNTITSKSLTVILTSTGTITDYLVKVTILSSREDVAASYAEITSEIYEENGVYHWSIEDSGRYVRVDVQSIGTADASNYVSVKLVLEGTG